MKPVALLLVATLTIATAATPAATLPTVSNPEEVGVSRERLRRAHDVLQGYIDRGEVAGTVALVARKGRVVHFEAQGVADLATKKPMATDAIFRLASMTKPVTSIALMMLHEEGRFLLDDPISKFLPEFAHPKVAVPNAPNERAGAGYRLVPAEREITFRHVLTHTAGLASGTGGPTMELSKKLAAERKPDDLLAAHITRLAALPLNFQPGTAWEYGPGTDVCGRLVEVISGKNLDQFFRERILGPLGMDDTWFYLPDGKLPRLTTAYKWDEKSRSLEMLPAPGPASRTAKYYSGGGGLAGTAEDYLKFAQMLLNGGQFNGKRLVSRKTIEMMTTSNIGGIPLWQDSLRGYTFGLGFRVRENLGNSLTLGSTGEYGWGGAYGTYFWVDPKEQTIGVLMVQLMPYAHLNIRPDFQNAVTQAIID